MAAVCGFMTQPSLLLGAYESLFQGSQLNAADLTITILSDLATVCGVTFPFLVGMGAVLGCLWRCHLWDSTPRAKLARILCGWPGFS